MLDRRQLLKLAGSMGAAFAAGGCAAGRGPLPAGVWKPLAENELPFAGLATSLPEEHDYEPEIEGRLPVELRGTLYRIGPGLFDRAGLRKRMILDGDGMICAFRFDRGRVRFRNRYVRTRKYVEEEAEGRFLYATWGTPAPGGALANLGGRLANQASVTIIRRGQDLYAFDEYAQPYRLDAESLDTAGPSDLGFPEMTKGFKAHWKVDGTTGEWLLFGMEYGRTNLLHVASVSPNGCPGACWSVEVPWRVYIHDWLVTERHVVFVLHPAIIPTGAVISMFLGLGTIGGMVRWTPELGNRILVVDREGKGKPVWIETEATWMWHGVNAYERKGEIVADFCGSKGFTGIGSPDPPMFAIMEGRYPRPFPIEALPLVRRYVIDPGGKAVREEIVAGDDHYEMPFVNPRRGCCEHRYAYFAKGGGVDWFWTNVARVDVRTGKVECHDFGRRRFCGEPVFVPDPAASSEPESGKEPGWVLTLVYDGDSRKSVLAVLEAERLSAGPVALIPLRHHVPFNFHGYWHAEG
jgi:all-trans-8'-apo-beta-carotenal 15,15'-oxygenase